MTVNPAALNMIAVVDHARFAALVTQFRWSDDEQLAVASFVSDSQDRSFTNGQHSMLPN